MSLRITEIFHSIQGESNTVGLPTVFVRLTGCPMRCTYCDTAYAFYGGQRIALDDIIAQVASYQTNAVTITGGEPLAQPNCLPLLTRLCDDGYRVSLETGGGLDISQVDPRVYIVLDIKTPASGEAENNDYANLSHLKPSDCVKFVICDRADYQWAIAQVQQHSLTQLCEVFFSPCADQLSPTDLANWIIADKLAVRLQIQLHKVLWGNAQAK